MDSLIGLFVNDVGQGAAIPYRHIDCFVAKKFDKRDEKPQQEMKIMFAVTLTAMEVKQKSVSQISGDSSVGALGRKGAFWRLLDLWLRKFQIFFFKYAQQVLLSFNSLFEKFKIPTRRSPSGFHRPRCRAAAKSLRFVTSSVIHRFSMLRTTT